MPNYWDSEIGDRFIFYLQLGFDDVAFRALDERDHLAMFSLRNLKRV